MESSPDLTKLLEEHTELKNSFEAAQDLIGIAPAFFGYVSADGHVLNLNNLAVRVIGATREQVIGKLFWECPWWKPIPQSAQHIHDAVKKASQGHFSKFDVEYWAKSDEKKEGQVRWVAIQISPTVNSSGKVSRIAVTGIDVTDRKEVEAKLTFERNQLETLFQQSPAAMVLWTGPDFVFEKVNPQYQAIFPDRELQGKPFLEICPEFKDQPFHALLTKVLETGETFIGREILARLKDRQDGPLEDHYYDFTYMRVTDANGRPYGVYDHAIDVTDRVLDRKRIEESEERLRLALEGARMGVWSILGMGSTMTLISDARTQELHGVSEMENFDDVVVRRIYQEDQQTVKATINDSIARGIPYACEYRIESGDDSFRWIHARGEPKYDHKTKEFISISGVVFDISDLKRTESALQKAVVARDTFLGIASHELKTPLTSLKLQSQINLRILDEHGPSAFPQDRIRKVIEGPVTQIDRLSRLVDDMLDISRISSGRLSMTFERVDLSKLVKDTFQRLSGQLEAAKCLVSYTIDSEVSVNADQFRFEQVLTNLITNAVKYAAGNPIEVSLKKNAQSTVLRIRDHGPGIPVDKLERVFERFERLVSASEVSGLGLGLYISKEIVEAHKGEIHVESAVEKGAEFVVTLPLYREN